MGTKVVYNACYGGFSLSREAVLLGREISGDQNWCPESIIGDKCAEGNVTDRDYGFTDMDRHDSILVAVVEQLGKQASGECAELKIYELDGRLYKIEEYDGYESVIEPEGVEWVSAQ